MSRKDKLHPSPKHCCYQLHSPDFACVRLTLFRSKNTNVYFQKITPKKIVMLSEYKGQFQHRFRSKCYRCVFLNLSPKKSLEVIPFILIPELRQSNAPLSSVAMACWGSFPQLIPSTFFQQNMIWSPNKGADAFRQSSRFFLQARRMYTLKQHMYLNANLYLSRKYRATVVLVLGFDASSSISNCSFSADRFDTPQTVYFLFIVAKCVVSIFTPNRQ